MNQPLTDAELQGLAAQAFNLAKLDLERRQFVWLLASYHRGEQLRRMKRVEKYINDVLGEDWLNSGAKKDAAFETIRIATFHAPPDAVVFASVCNHFEPTEQFARLSPEAQQKLLDAGHDRHHQAACEGLLTCSDALVTLAQTPFRICNRVQKLGRDGPFGTPQVHIFDAKDFEGRLKLYGRPSEELKPWLKRRRQ